ncbi:MAG: SDR family oxidoreductase [Candidatus Hydrogenedentes bacterium]|nr:SDR family oxidoreductase [Candidatus Hydrogenedentota bacterium]
MRNVAFISGASRGIGKAIGLKLASEGWDIVVAAKTEKDTPKLPGTIYSAAEEMRALGANALPVVCNVASQESIDAAVEKTLAAFGRVDAVINNAGALWWKNMEETPMKRFDLVMNVNVRAAFALTAGFLPTLKKQNSGHIIMMSPPVDLRVIPGHIAYMISKFGMTMIAFGLAEELRDSNISATALWPKTVIESYATINYHLGDPSVWRKADILADATFEILRRPAETKGKAFLDEDFLRSIGYTDFEKYNCVPGGQPMILDWNTAGAAQS